MNTSELIKTLVKQCGPEDNIPLWYVLIGGKILIFTVNAAVKFKLNSNS